MKRRNLLWLTQTALFSAIIIVMTFLPQVGYIQYGPAFTITTIPIPVIVGACILGPVGGGVLGLVWGVTSLIKSMMIGGIEMALFLNPLVSVLPRILVGLIASGIFIGVNKLFGKSTKPRGKQIVPFAAAGLLGALSNTALVLTAIQLFGSLGMFELGSLFQAIFGTVITVNGIFELVLTGLLVPAIGIAVQRAQKKLGHTFR